MIPSISSPILPHRATLSPASRLIITSSYFKPYIGHTALKKRESHWLTRSENKQCRLFVPKKGSTEALRVSAEYFFVDHLKNYDGIKSKYIKWGVQQQTVYHCICIAENVCLKVELNTQKSLPLPLSSPQIRKAVCRNRWATRQNVAFWDWSWTWSGITSQ